MVKNWVKRVPRPIPLEEKGDVEVARSRDSSLSKLEIARLRIEIGGCAQVRGGLAIKVRNTGPRLEESQSSRRTFTETRTPRRRGGGWRGVSGVSASSTSLDSRKTVKGAPRLPANALIRVTVLSALRDSRVNRRRVLDNATLISAVFAGYTS